MKKFLIVIALLMVASPAMALQGVRPELDSNLVYLSMAYVELRGLKNCQSKYQIPQVDRAALALEKVLPRLERPFSPQEIATIKEHVSGIWQRLNMELKFSSADHCSDASGDVEKQITAGMFGTPEHEKQPQLSTACTGELGVLAKPTNRELIQKIASAAINQAKTGTIHMKVRTGQFDFPGPILKVKEPDNAIIAEFLFLLLDHVRPNDPLYGALQVLHQSFWTSLPSADLSMDQ